MLLSLFLLLGNPRLQPWATQKLHKSGFSPWGKSSTMSSDLTKRWPALYRFASVSGLSCAIATSFLSGCYQGVANSEKLQILQIAYGAPNRVAMIVERSDHAALSGSTFFVLISDHAYPMSELRKRIYGLDPVFVAGREGLDIHWSGPNELEIECHSCGITPDIVEKQLYSKIGVAIRYVGFPKIGEPTTEKP